MTITSNTFYFVKYKYKCNLNGTTNHQHPRYSYQPTSWLKLTTEKKRNVIDSLGCTVPEIVPTQQMRQERFDNWELTDDHGMHIYGVAKDQNGKEYYMVKNSWGESGDYKGTWYMTKAFIAANTMDFLVNKKAIPANIRKKLGL